MRSTCSLVIMIISVIMMLGLVVSDPPLPPSLSSPPPYPYYDRDESTTSTAPLPPSVPYESPSLAKKKRSPPPPPSPLHPPPPPAVHFDFFKLVETWPKTFCLTIPNCRTNMQPKFVIHGFWPSINGPSDSQPKDCSAEPANFVMLSVYTKLPIEWPSLINARVQLDKDSRFWGEQWKKHGTCSSMNAENYFKLTIEIHKRTILKDVLQKEGIIPDPKKPRTRVEIFDAIKKGIGAKPEILCIEHDKKYYVKEIRMCLDKSTDHKYIDCARDFVDCPPDVYFP